MVSNIKKHKKHLAVVSPKVVEQKLKDFHLKDVRMKELPFDCQSFTIKTPLEEYVDWLHPLDPRSLDDLKNWFGVPNKTAKDMLEKTSVIGDCGKPWPGAIQVIPKAFPVKADWDYSELDNEQQLAVRQMSKNLLYGYVSPESRETTSIKKVVDYMLVSAKRMKVQIFVAPDLIICPDEVVEINNVSVLYFNNILIYGNGKLVTRGNTSIHAAQIKRVL